MSNVISFGKHKAKLELEGIKVDSDEEFSARMTRIRQSLERINTLMEDLKKNPKEV